MRPVSSAVRPASKYNASIMAAFRPAQLRILVGYINFQGNKSTEILGSHLRS